MPQITEEMVGVYLQILTAILVFGLGIPALIMQVIVPEEIRRVVHGNRWAFKWGVAFVILVAVLMWFLLWVFTAYSDNRGFSKIEWMCTFGIHRSICNWINHYQYFLVNMIMTAAVLSSLVFWFLQASYRRDRVLGFLRRTCIRRLKSAGYLDEYLLSDIRELGIQSRTDVDRWQVIEVLEDLRKCYMDRKAYSGSGIEPLLETLEATIVSGGDYHSTVMGLKILDSVLWKLINDDLTDEPDGWFVFLTIQHIGFYVIEKDLGSALLMLINSLGKIAKEKKDILPALEKALFQLGINCLGDQKNSHALAILDKFETIIGDNLPLTENNSLYYLGFLAHLWESEVNVRKRIKFRIRQIEIKPNFRKCCQYAAKEHYRGAHFDTSEKIELMMNQWNKY